MWTASPVMACVIFGIPVLVITFIVSMLCCLEPASDDDELDHEGLAAADDNNEEPRDFDDVTHGTGHVEGEVGDVKPADDEPSHLKSD